MAGASGSNADPEGKVQDISGNNVLSSLVSGSTREMSIKFSVLQADCDDAAMYTFPPGQLSPTMKPDRTAYSVNSPLTLTCHGKGNGDKSHPAISDGMRLGMGIVARVMVLLVASFVLIIVLVC
nr:hypothetical protein BaRGS_021919 [Batillaria attramentaria]